MLSIAISSLIFAVIGILVETGFTAVYNSIKTKDWRKLKGDVSILMFPVYFIAYAMMSCPLSWIFIYFKLGIVTKVLFITGYIYLSEYTAGYIYEKFGFEPWKYNHAFKMKIVVFPFMYQRDLRFDIKGKITILYLPFWLFF